MPSMQRVIVIGHLGRDPELRYLANGTAVASFSVAVSKRWRGKDNEMQEKTTWFKVVAWDKRAEFAGKYLKKGQLAYVEGEMDERSWEDKEGNKRYAWELVAIRIENLSPRERDEEGATVPTAPAEDAPPDDIPF